MCINIAREGCSIWQNRTKQKYRKMFGFGNTEYTEWMLFLRNRSI